jgi:plasmid stability protein
MCSIKLLRIAADVHKRLRIQAAAEGVSMADLANKILSDNLKDLTINESNFSIKRKLDVNDLYKMILAIFGF